MKPAPGWRRRPPVLPVLLLLFVPFLPLEAAGALGAPGGGEAATAPGAAWRGNGSNGWHQREFSQPEGREKVWWVQPRGSGA